MAKPRPYHWLVILAFFFSWAGDLLLMFGWKNEMFFFAGVGGFFLSQITYIQVFRKYSVSEGKKIFARKPIWILPFAIYLVSIYLYVYPHLEGIMKPVVALYACSLIGMCAAAFNRIGLVNSSSFQILFIGAIFFVISDSLLAINKFANPIPISGFLVMSTYMLAQYLIMLGLIRSSNSYQEKTS